MNTKFATCLAVILARMLFTPIELCAGQNILFYKESRNYGREGRQGEIFRQEFEARMFKNANWHERLFINLYEPAVDQTLEVYTKPDGSRWLSYRRATPSMSPLFGPSFPGERYDITKELAAVRVRQREIELPANVANEIELLWRAMLPGLPHEPESRRIYMDYPAFVAFERNNNSVHAGRIAMAAMDTPAYDSFVQIVEDLMRACSGEQKDRRLLRLPFKIQHLRALLKKN